MGSISAIVPADRAPQLRHRRHRSRRRPRSSPARALRDERPVASGRRRTRFRPMTSGSRPSERAVLAGLAVAKRRADWRLGRWTAKALRRRSARCSGSPRRGPGGRRRRSGRLRRRCRRGLVAEPVPPRRRRRGRRSPPGPPGWASISRRSRPARTRSCANGCRATSRRRCRAPAKPATCRCSAAGRARKPRPRCCAKACDSTFARPSSPLAEPRPTGLRWRLAWRTEGIVHHGWWLHDKDTVVAVVTDPPLRSADLLPPSGGDTVTVSP